MLATFVIGLREGLEAALIVGIIAAFLKRDGNAAALRRMWLGVGLAALLCLGIGVTLSVLSGSLPQRQQEMLESTIGFVAVAMVTWMVLWMRNHSKDLKRDLGAAVGGALATGSALALVGMAFLAVIREGIETAVFLVAAAQTGSAVSTLVGAALGVAIAVVLGYLIYRGGVRLNLSRFFRITGVVLVLVAGGVLMSAIQHAYEAGWITIGRTVWLDFSGFIAAGSVQESLLTGVLGIRAQLTAIDVLAWLLYVLPMLVVVCWPPRRPLRRAVVARLLLGCGAVAGAMAATLALVVPSPGSSPEPAGFTLTGAARGDVVVTVDRVTGASATATLRGSVRTEDGEFVIDRTVPLELAGAQAVAGRSGQHYTGAALSLAGPAPTTLSAEQLAELNGGRYPVGLRSAGDARLSATRTLTWTPSLVLDVRTGAPLTLGGTVSGGVIAATDTGRSFRIDAGGGAINPTTAGTAAASTLARSTAADRQRAELWGVVVPWALGVWAVLALAAGLVLTLHRPASTATRETPAVPATPTASAASPEPIASTARSEGASA